MHPPQRTGRKWLVLTVTALGRGMHPRDTPSLGGGGRFAESARDAASPRPRQFRLFDTPLHKLQGTSLPSVPEWIQRRDAAARETVIHQTAARQFAPESALIN
jgi:hypothetical protein